MSRQDPRRRERRKQRAYAAGRALRWIVLTTITTLRDFGRLIGDMIVEAWERGTGVAVAAFIFATFGTCILLVTVRLMLRWNANIGGTLLVAAMIVGTFTAWSIYSDEPDDRPAERQTPPAAEQTPDSTPAEPHADTQSDHSDSLDASQIDIEDDERSDDVDGQYVTDPPALDFTDVAGMEDLKDELRERVIEPLENPAQYEEYGLSVENGFLLYGPPGTGKTYISKALAGELGINYMEVKGSDLISQWIGEGTENVAELFEEARANQPAMLFVDEIDALTPERGGANQHQDQTQMVNQFLEEISEINENEQDVVLVAATNRRDQIDDAMLRSGRLSVQIEVPPPGPQARVKIFDQHLDAPRGADLDPQQIAEQSSGLTAADMEQVATEAARSAMRRDSDVTMDDIEDAIEQVRGEA